MYNAALAQIVKVERLDSIVAHNTVQADSNRSIQAQLCPKLLKQRKLKVRKDLDAILELRSNDREAWTKQNEVDLHIPPVPSVPTDNHVNSSRVIAFPIPEEDKASKYPPLGGALGNFCKIVVQFDETPSKQVTCSCSTFMTRGTCDESRLFSLLTKVRYPDSSCTPSVFVGWKIISNDLSVNWNAVSKLQRTAREHIIMKNRENQISNTLYMLPPAMDPWSTPKYD